MTTLAMKGTLQGVTQLGAIVTLWVASPTGDASDSHLFDIPCINETQAQLIATQWRKVLEA